jgi:hypothetical protein
MRMLTYKAMYKFLEFGVHAQVVDFPGAITCGATEDEARRLLASALVDMARPATDPDSDLEEPIHLLLTAASRVELVPQSLAS